MILLTIISIFVFIDYSTTEITSLITLFFITIIRLIPLLGKLITYINSVSNFAPSLSILKDEIKDHSNNIDIDSNINSNQLNNLNKIDLEEIEFVYPESGVKIFYKVKSEIFMMTI